MVMNNLVKIVGHSDLVIARPGVVVVASAAVVGSDDPVASVRDRSDDMSPLI